MSIALDPEGGFLEDEEQPPAEHDWSGLDWTCKRCGISYKFFVDSETPCKEMPE